MSIELPWTSVINTVGGIVSKLIPDPEAKAQAMLALHKMELDGELEKERIQLSAILAEANSPDPYTSRARPTMLYVFYILILAGLPMGMLAAFSPGTAADIAVGFRAWLKAIPDNIIDMATFVMLGYIGGRTFEKIKGAA